MPMVRAAAGAGHLHQQRHVVDGHVRRGGYRKVATILGELPAAGRSLD
jgi:hypothetical protein